MRLAATLSAVVVLLAVGWKCVFSPLAPLRPASTEQALVLRYQPERLIGFPLEGQTIAIQGSAFGSHPMSLVFEDFEDLPLGSTPTAWGPGWKVCTSSQGAEPRVSTAKPWSGDRGVRAYKGPAPNSGFAYEHAPFRELYATWRTYWNPLTESGCTEPWGGQWKMWRLNSSPSYNFVTDNVNDWLGSGNGLIATGRFWTITHLRCADPRDFNATSWCYPGQDPQERYGYPPNDMRRWVRWSIWIKASSAIGARDGKFLYTMQREGEPETVVNDWTADLCTHRSAAGAVDLQAWPEWTRMVWQNYYGNCGMSSEWFHDDIYLSFGSQARVELGNAAQYAACTIREVQPLVHWSSDSVSFTLRFGGMSRFVEAWVFLIDSTGRPSQGVALSRSEPPPPPRYRDRPDENIQ